MTKPVRGVRKKKATDKAALLDIVTNSIVKNRAAVEEQLAQAVSTGAVEVLSKLAWLFKSEVEEKGGHDKAIIRIEFHPNGKPGKGGA